MYNGCLYNSLGVIEDLIVGIKMARVEMWHQEAMLCQGLRNQLYLKENDPYNFNPLQF